MLRAAVTCCVDMRENEAQTAGALAITAAVIAFFWKPFLKEAKIMASLVVETESAVTP